MITKPLLKTLRDEIDTAVASIGQKHGVILKCGNASFTTDSATFKLNVSSIQQDGTVVTKDAAAFKMYAKSFGLTESDLFKEITYAGKNYQIIGMAPRSFRFPILAKNLANGKIFKLPANGVARALGKTLTLTQQLSLTLAQQLSTHPTVQGDDVPQMPDFEDDGTNDLESQCS